MFQCTTVASSDNCFYNNTNILVIIISDHKFYEIRVENSA